MWSRVRIRCRRAVFLLKPRLTSFGELVSTACYPADAVLMPNKLPFANCRSVHSFNPLIQCKIGRNVFLEAGNRLHAPRMS